MAVAEQAQAALDFRNIGLPPSPPVVGIEAEEYVDSAGQDALRIWVILDENTDVDQLPGRAVIALKGAIHDALLSKGIREFPYISLAKPSERVAATDEE
ncbi:MAG: hypothetical protein WD872_07650 [Pirellulaceae bacterium]